MGRTPCCKAEGLKKGAWSADEDQKLIAYIHQHGQGSWSTLPQKAGLQRCGKSCRLRWANYLRPDIKRGDFSTDEKQKIIQLHATLGNRWSAIARHLPRRTDNEIKNYWNTHLKKRLAGIGIDRVAHRPDGQSPSLSNDINNNGSNNTANYRGTDDQYETAPTRWSKSSSSSTVRLLNKLASKLASSPFLHAVRDGVIGQNSLSTGGDSHSDKDVIDCTYISSIDYSPSVLAVSTPLKTANVCFNFG